MRKLYKRGDDGVLLYHEAWSNGKQVVEHFGRAGDRGETRNQSLDKALSEDENIDNVLRQAVSNGFRDIDEEQNRYLLVEYAIDGFGTDADLTKRHELEDRMNETLGWTGLGHCDGGSTGSGTMEVCCIVVDFDLARGVIQNDLKDTKFADFTRIFDQSES